MKKIYFILLCSLSIYLNAQSVSKGVVMDASTQTSIPGASVYIDGSFMGTSTNGEGVFYLSNFPKPPYRLTISSIGYETATVDITKETKQVQIYLKPKPLELQEVIIKAADPDGWEKFGQDFLENFLGYSEFSKECKIKNPKAVSFLYNDKNFVLRVYSEEPLIIENKALGYTLTYWLQDFEADFLAQTVFFKGSCQFKDMTDSKTRRKTVEKWSQNRQTAYLGSVQHFISCLYNDSIDIAGFQIRKMNKIVLADYYLTVPKDKDTIIYTDSTMLQLSKRIEYPMSLSGSPVVKLSPEHTAKRFEMWYQDSSANNIMRYKTYDNNLLQSFFIEMEKYGENNLIISKYAENSDLERRAVRGVVDIIDSTLLKMSEIVCPLNIDSKSLKFDNYLHITYWREFEEEAYQLRVRPRQKPIRKYQTNTVSLRDVDSVTIFSNGYYEPAYGLFFDGYWSFEKIDKLLPLEYRDN